MGGWDRIRNEDPTVNNENAQSKPWATSCPDNSSASIRKLLPFPKHLALPHFALCKESKSRSLLSRAVENSFFFLKKKNVYYFMIVL